METKEVTVAIGRRLNLARTMSGLSGRRLGELAGVGPAYVLGVEAARWGDPKLGGLKKVAAVLGLSEAWLLSGEGEPPTEGYVVAAVEESERQALEEGRVRALPPRAPRRQVHTCPKCGHIAGAA